MCRLKKRFGLIPSDAKWKVTARYELLLSPNRRVQCVRLHCYWGGSGVGITLHFSKAEFDRLFMRIPE
jgi:hypothetical protein